MVLVSNAGVNYRVNLPTLDQYVALTPRHVTPVLPLLPITTGEPKIR